MPGRFQSVGMLGGPGSRLIFDETSLIDTLLRGSALDWMSCSDGTICEGGGKESAQPAFGWVRPSTIDVAYRSQM